MNSKTAFNWKDLGLVLLSLLTLGAGWIVDHQVTVIAALSVAIVWVLGWAGRTFTKYTWIKGKAFLTILVFAVAFILSLFIQPFHLHAFPAWTSDASTFAPLLADYFAGLFAAVSDQVLFAIGIYNVLLARVLEKASAQLTERFG